MTVQGAWLGGRRRLRSVAYFVAWLAAPLPRLGMQTVLFPLAYAQDVTFCYIMLVCSVVRFVDTFCHHCQLPQCLRRVCLPRVPPRSRKPRPCDSPALAETGRSFSGKRRCPALQNVKPAAASPLASPLGPTMVALALSGGRVELLHLHFGA